MQLFCGMKLYAHPGASSLSVHILLREIGAPFTLEIVDVTHKQRQDGSDYRVVAPRGMVPVLELDDGSTLTENLVIAQFLCDAYKRSDLLPEVGAPERYTVLEWQSFTAAELHKSFVPLRWPLDEATRQIVLERIHGRFLQSERAMIGPFLTGPVFTAADAYFFVIASWMKYFDVPLAPYPKVSALLRAVGQRPSVRSALAAEGQGMVVVEDVAPLV